MKKTRRWAVLFSLLVLVQVGDVMLYAYDDDYRYYSDWWIPQYSSPYLENLMQGIVPDAAAYAVFRRADHSVGLGGVDWHHLCHGILHVQVDYKVQL